MSILIKGMEMPQYCGTCHVGFCKQIGCDKYIGFDNYATSRHPDCPLVEVVRTGEGLYDTYTPPDKETAKHVTEVFRKSTERMEAEV